MVQINPNNFQTKCGFQSYKLFWAERAGIVDLLLYIITFSYEIICRSTAKII